MDPLPVCRRDDGWQIKREALRHKAARDQKQQNGKAQQGAWLGHGGAALAPLVPNLREDLGLDHAKARIGADSFGVFVPTECPVDDFFPCECVGPYVGEYVGEAPF